jgi:hypothetical protein
MATVFPGPRYIIERVSYHFVSMYFIVVQKQCYVVLSTINKSTEMRREVALV